MIITGKRKWKLLSISNFTRINKGGLELKKKLRKDFTPIYLLKRKEFLVLHLHHSSRNVVVPETLLELDPGEGVAVPLGKTPTNQELSLAVALLRTELAPYRRTEQHPTGIPLSEASRQPRVDQSHGRTSAGDPSESPRACRGAAAVEEVVAERGSAAESEQCCSEWPSSAFGGGRTAPESDVEASAAAGWYSGCSAPGGQNRCRCSWC
jgi:hypothetical protein